jgi:hypothetical protein
VPPDVVAGSTMVFVAAGRRIPLRALASADSATCQVPVLASSEALDLGPGHVEIAAVSGLLTAPASVVRDGQDGLAVRFDSARRVTQRREAVRGDVELSLLVAVRDGDGPDRGADEADRGRDAGGRGARVPGAGARGAEVRGAGGRGPRGPGAGSRGGLTPLRGAASESAADRPVGRVLRGRTVNVSAGGLLAVLHANPEGALRVGMRLPAEMTLPSGEQVSAVLQVVELRGWWVRTAFAQIDPRAREKLVRLVFSRERAALAQRREQRRVDVREMTTAPRLAAGSGRAGGRAGGRPSR